MLKTVLSFGKQRVHMKLQIVLFLLIIHLKLDARRSFDLLHVNIQPQMFMHVLDICDFLFPGSCLPAT